MNQDDPESQYFDKDGYLTSVGSGYLDLIYMLFALLKQACKDEMHLVFTDYRTGQGHILRDGVKYFQWDNFEDAHTRIEKLRERGMLNQ